MNYLLNCFNSEISTVLSRFNAVVVGTLLGGQLLQVGMNVMSLVPA